MKLNFCHSCRRRSTTEVDHFVGKADGGTAELDNLQLICEGCRGLKTGRKEAPRRRAETARTAPKGVPYLGDGAHSIAPGVLHTRPQFCLRDPTPTPGQKPDAGAAQTALDARAHRRLPIAQT